MGFILTKIKPPDSIRTKRWTYCTQLTLSLVTLALFNLCLYFLPQQALRLCCQMRSSQSPFEISRLVLLLSPTPGHLYQWGIQKNRGFAHGIETQKYSWDKQICRQPLAYRVALIFFTPGRCTVNDGKTERGEQNDSKRLTHYLPPVKVPTKTNSCDKQDEIIIKVSRQLRLLKCITHS